MPNLITRPNGPFLTGGPPWDSQDTGSVTENADVAPDGTNTAWILGDGSGTGIYSIYWDESVVASAAAYCAWVCIKKAAATVQPLLTLRFGGASSYASPSKIVGITCNPSTGGAVPVAAWGTPELDHGSIDLGDYFLFYAVSANNGADHVYAGFGPAIADAAGNVGVGHIGSHTFWTAGLAQATEPEVPALSGSGDFFSFF